jgi:hypothetical protein
MPQVSRFYGISSCLYYRDHAPPHFHAIYGDTEAFIEIGNARIIAGSLPRLARKLVLEWVHLHGDELRRNW